MSLPLDLAAPPLETDRWFRTLAETSATAIFAYRDRFLYVNRACEELTGYSSAELLAMELTDLVVPEFRPLVEERVRARLGGETGAAQYEFQIRRKDGAARWFEVNGGTIELDGQLVGLATGIDVTDRKHAEKALRDSEQWFRTLAETTATAIMVYSAERLIYVNRACIELTGRRAEDILALAPWQLAHPAFQPLVRERVTARLRGETVVGRYEIKILTGDGKERWVDFTAGRIQGQEGDGEVLGLGTAIDITERKLAEIALRESGARMELAQRVAGLVTWEWDLESDALVLSDNATEVLGCAPGAAWQTADEFAEAIVPEDRERFADAVRRCLRGGEDLSVDVRIATPDGRQRWISERARALHDPPGTAVRVIGIAHDIDHRKQAEDALAEEKERAQVTLASIGDGVIRTDAAGHRRLPEPGRRAADRLERRRGHAASRSRDVFNVVDEAGAAPLPNPVERCLPRGGSIELPGYSLLRAARRRRVRRSATRWRRSATAQGRITGSGPRVQGRHRSCAAWSAR